MHQNNVPLFIGYEVLGAELESWSYFDLIGSTKEIGVQHLHSKSLKGQSEGVGYNLETCSPRRVISHSTQGTPRRPSSITHDGE